MNTLIYIRRFAGKLAIVFLIPVLFSSCSSEQQDSISRENRIRIILDTDANNELDDQHAIAYMLFNGNIFDVEGITVNKTSNGGDINKQVEEAERIVKLCSLNDKVKVYKGASGSYEEIKDHVQQPHFDGEEAVKFIIERANVKDGRKLYIVAVGKITNMALALTKEPSIASKIHLLWLASNWPDMSDEFNLVHDKAGVNPVLKSGVELEVAVVRYGQPSGTAAVTTTLEDIRRIMPGKGPHISMPIPGRSGGMFTNFGDYSVDLFNKAGNAVRSLYDVSAVAILKNPHWAEKVEIDVPKWTGDKWVMDTKNACKVAIWENFKTREIIKDFYNTMDNYVLVK